MWPEMGKRATGCEDFAAGALEEHTRTAQQPAARAHVGACRNPTLPARPRRRREGVGGELGVETAVAGAELPGAWQEEGSSPDLEALRARQQRLRELKAGLAAAHLEAREHIKRLRTCLQVRVTMSG